VVKENYVNLELVAQRDSNAPTCIQIKWNVNSEFNASLKRQEIALINTQTSKCLEKNRSRLKIFANNSQIMENVKWSNAGTLINYPSVISSLLLIMKSINKFRMAVRFYKRLSQVTSKHSFMLQTIAIYINSLSQIRLSKARFLSAEDPQSSRHSRTCRTRFSSELN
jgi:hypothetical protein